MLLGSTTTLGCGQAESYEIGSGNQHLTEADATGSTAPPDLMALAGDEGGIPVASDDLLAVASPASGTLRVLTSQSGSWVETARFRSEALVALRAHRIALAVAPDTIVLGVPRRYVPPPSASVEGVPGEQLGAVEVYTNVAARWAGRETLLDPTGRAQTEFGRAVALDSDLLAVGAPAAPAGGAVHLYRRGGQRYELLASLVGQAQRLPSQFGTSVAIAGDRLFVGAPADSQNGYGNGAVHVFDIASARDGRVDPVTILRADDALPRKTPTCTQSSCRSLPRTVEGFGWSLAVTAGYLAVGAPGAGNDRLMTATGPGPGAIYIFAPAVSASGWLLTGVIQAPGGARRFGTTLVAVGETISVGVPINSDGPTDGLNRRGRVETFARPSPSGAWLHQRSLDVSIRPGSDQVHFTPSSWGLIVAGERDDSGGALYVAR